MIKPLIRALPYGQVVIAVGVGMLLAAATLAAFVVAPTEATMGDAQRIVYLHVAVAWSGLASCVVMGTAGALYLLTRNIGWDHWSHAAGEIGWLCTSLTLFTGSLWAHEAWNTWWVWEPRLTASFLLWMMYAGFLLVRSIVDEPDRRARLGAVVALLATADLPLVVMATRWFRGIHPVTPEMDPRMRMVLLASVVSFSALFACLAAARCRQLQLITRLARAERELGAAAGR